jgi:uncharacterized protein
MADFRIGENEITFWLRVKPRSSRERLARGSDGELNLELHAPATDGQANEACIQFLARFLHLPKSSVEIVSGHNARRKLIRVMGKSPAEIVARMESFATTGKG